MPEKSIRTILYATDFSESSVPACDYALTLSRLTGAHLHVLNVIGELSDDQRSLMPPQSLADLERELEIKSVRDIETFCRDRFGGQVDFTTHVEIGTPFREILGKAQEVQADMIVMGTHGRTGIEHVIVGSTAERIVRRSKIPVLTIRSGT